MLARAETRASARHGGLFAIDFEVGSVIPLFHDFTDETVLVFGGGPVGARKARRFAEEADVVVVSPEFADADFGGAERVRGAPDAEEIGSWIDRTDPALVVAATDDGALNEAIAVAANERGVLVNQTDQSGERDANSVVVPATVEDGPVTMAVSTDGTSPAVSKYLRERFEEEFAGVGEMAELTADLRQDLRDEGMGPAERRAAVRRVVKSDRVWKALDSGRSNPSQVVSAVISNNTGDSS